MARENFQIYTVQITGKYIYETFPPSLHDLIIRPHVKQSSHKFAQKSLFLHEKPFFFLKKVLPYFFFGGEETLCFIFISFTISKSFIPNFMPNYGFSKQNYLATVFLKSCSMVMKVSKLF